MPEGLFAAMAANRMRTRQSYRTMARMQRRRSFMQDRMGMRQDFQQAGTPQQYADPPPEAAPAEPGYVAELERLAQLRDQGVITADDFEAKKRQLLGI
jgi:Short C-terminal domain